MLSFVTNKKTDAITGVQKQLYIYASPICWSTSLGVVADVEI